jgi:diphosphomevalonate decarboxylase
MGGLNTQTTVEFSPTMKDDVCQVNGSPLSSSSLSRVSQHLDIIRNLADLPYHASVISDTNFPIGAGIASSASAFAALTLAACAATGLELDPEELSRISRKGSGSACRSVYGGYVEWYRGETDQESFAQPLYDKNHWDLIDLVAVVETEHKSTGSTTGHKLADSSPLQVARVADTSRRLQICRIAIEERDFETLASIAELDSNMMHAVMMTSSPALMYWHPVTIEIMKSVLHWRNEGLEVFYTIDAGPNVHCICTSSSAGDLSDLLSNFPGVKDLIHSYVGGHAQVI